LSRPPRVESDTRARAGRGLVFIAERTKGVFMRAQPLTVLLLVLGLLLPPVTTADTAEEIERIKQRWHELLPQVEPDAIEPTPIPGLYAVRYRATVYYFSADGRYLVSGSMIDLDTREDLTEKLVAGYRKAQIDAVPESEMIVYSPKEKRHTVTVFTDIDCPYCRKLHREMAEYNKRGIEVRYLAFPRAGVGSESYKKAVSVWCAKDRNAAMDKAKAGEPVEEKTCDNPVRKQMALGNAVGVEGTPAIVLENGEMIPGYQPAARLAAKLDGMKAEKRAAK
jgi:thiol:disulfide interchange protein DsbC